MRDIKDAIEEISRLGYFDDIRPSWVNEGIEPFFAETLKLFNMKMLPEYKEIVSWMTKNDGLGLIMTGSNGRGKTLIAKKIIPLFLYTYFDKVVEVYDYTELNDKTDEIMKRKYLILDDIGQEDARNNYGEKSQVFSDVIDRAEKRGNLVVITTNLTPDWIEQKYGIRTRERIRACCKTIVFKGESMRK